MDEASGRCPLEDVGGPWDYVEMLETIGDKARNRHAEIGKRLGEFNPKDFDPELLKAGNAALAKRRSRTLLANIAPSLTRESRRMVTLKARGVFSFPQDAALMFILPMTKKNWSRNLFNVSGNVGLEDWTLCDGAVCQLAGTYYHIFGLNAGRWLWKILDGKPFNAGTKYLAAEAESRDSVIDFLRGYPLISKNLTCVEPTMGAVATWEISLKFTTKKN